MRPVEFAPSPQLECTLLPTGRAPSGLYRAQRSPSPSSTSLPCMLSHPSSPALSREGPTVPHVPRVSNGAARIGGPRDGI
ncbi:hypothetical protein L226DRAFT_540711 [Lentinus tigrinus ALCF2SS1-7]|uniref:uncharacterized protein n=1 Tax=Lentinus tigrinus ALCF2SS1-7 TaxID=1328758 RepID=UPI001165E49D|nr:hypothetical protein L226DRAFT_540711 [Lentinus tigrinus ALCF2SS1-7]